MWYYTIHGNNSQKLYESDAQYGSQNEALTAGRKKTVKLTPQLGIVLSLQVGHEDLGS
jgi:hypothetical protein